MQTIRNLRLRGGPHQETTARVSVLQYSHALRFRNALIALLVCWALAAVSILIPVLHILLVPLLFFAGIVASVILWLRKGFIQSGDIKCPFCEHGMSFTSQKSTEGDSTLSRRVLNFPFYLNCVGCNQRIFVEQVSAQEA